MRAEAKHHWPDGKYIRFTPCECCGVDGYLQPKYAPARCWPCEEAARRVQSERQRQWLAAMEAEYGPYLPTRLFDVLEFDVFGDEKRRKLYLARNP